MPTYVPTAPNITKFMKGPGDLYVGVALPADGAFLAIAANGKLDQSVHTTAQAIASTEAGSKFTAKPKLEGETIDEVEGMLQRSVIGWDMTLSGKMREILRLDLIALMTPGCTLASDTVATPNTNKLKFGVGIPSFPAIAHIAKIPSSPANAPLFEVVMIYRAINDAGIDYELTRTKGVSTPYNFIADPVPSRSQDDMYGQYWIQGPLT
jgi:hypothetical protein